MYYGKAKENQASAPAVEYYRKAKENPNRETSDAGRSASLLGDWQIKGQKRAIHIEQCDLFVCGYVADSSNKEKVLIDLKPTSSSEWIGLIASAESNMMYPAVVILEDAKTLRVRACALGITFCEGQIWTREEPVLAAVHWLLRERSVAVDQSMTSPSLQQRRGVGGGSARSRSHAGIDRVETPPDPSPPRAARAAGGEKIRHGR
jgi:uncharacterized protein (DUF2147 family)